MAKLSNAPEEVTEFILLELDARDILSCSATCRRLKSLVDKSCELQLIIEVYASGYRLYHDWRNRLGASQSARDLLLAIKRKHFSKYKLEIHQKILIPSQDGEKWHAYRFLDGVLAHLSHPRSNTEEDQCFLRFYRLDDLIPLNSSSKSIVPWIHYKLQGLDEFIWDTSQDLLILAPRSEEKAFLRSLSTNEPHPDALYPTMPWSGIRKWKIVGPFLVMIAKQVRIGNHIKIWSWSTGRERLRKEAVTGFEVLTEDLIIMLVVDRDIACHNAGGQPNRLEIWSLSENAHRLTLNLPSHAHSYHAHIFDNPGPYISDETNPQLGLYVHDSAADRIVVLSIVYDQFSDDHRIGSMLVISVSEILNILASPHLHGRLNWSTWAPRATRWFKYPDSEDIIIYKAMVFIANQKVDDLSFGTSAILSHYTDEDSSIVLDFNRRSIRRDKQESLRVDDRNAAHHSAPPKLSTGAPPNTTMHIIEEEWKIDAFLCLKDVQSCLPFRIIIGEPVASSVRRNYFVVSDLCGILPVGPLDY